MNYAIDQLMRAAEDAEHERESHAEELAEITAERDEARADLARLRAQLAAHARHTEVAADAAAGAMREACLAVAAWNDNRFDGYDPRDVQETIEGAIRRLPLRALPLDAPGGGS